MISEEIHHSMTNEYCIIFGAVTQENNRSVLAVIFIL